MADNDNSAAVKVTIEKDKLKAYVEVFPPGEGGKTYSVQEIRQILNDHGVVFGIDDNRIMEALQPQNLGYKIMVAEGNPPVDGKDGQIINKFSLSGEGGPKIDEKGNVDYFDLGLIHNVKAGELLAERIPPTEGTPGQAVTGEEIPARRGKDFKLLRGSNTVINQDETQLYAVIDGHVSIIGNKIAVNPVYKVNGNVDYSTGNIDFIGNVVISGNIVSGFKVQAGGDIEVNGFIEGAEVYANGSVIVKGGIAGGNKGKVSAGENVVAKFIENSNVESGRDILVKDAIMQSFLKAGGSVKVDGSKAIIVGGLIQATHEVESKVMGSQLATQTIIEVGVNPKLRMNISSSLRSELRRKNFWKSLTKTYRLFNAAVSILRI
nr:FapA family protein [Syntrophomonas palmitatica]